MRVVSLVPSATEIIAALGLAGNLVGRSHECNYPSEVEAVPVVSASRIDTEQLGSADIDSAVREALSDGRPLYEVDAELLEQLAPDLIVTQDLCEVCAVSSGEVKRVSRIDVETVSLDPRDLEEIEDSIRTLARHLHAAAQGERLAQAFHHRIDFVHQLVRGLPRQRVFVAEWLDPPFAAGHWVPEQIRRAGGWDLLGADGEPSRQTTWTDVLDVDPEMLLLMPCGFHLSETVDAWTKLPRPPDYEELLAVRRERIFALDGSAYFSRPGPRVVDGIELLAEIFDPDAFVDIAPFGSWTPVDP